MSQVQSMGPVRWFKSGSPFVWLNAGAIALCIVMVIGLLSWIAYNGLSYFWPKPIVVAQYVDHEDGGVTKRLIGVIRDTEDMSGSILKAKRITVEGRAALGDERFVTRHSVKISNRFTNVIDPWLGEKTYPKEVYAVERTVDGEIFGFIWNVKQGGKIVAGKLVERDSKGKVTTVLTDDDHAAIRKAMTKLTDRAERLRAEVLDIEQHQIGSVNYDKEMLRRECLKISYHDDARLDCSAIGRLDKSDPRLAALNAENVALDTLNVKLISQRNAKNRELGRDSFTIEQMDGRVWQQKLSHVVFAYQSNDYDFWDKAGHFFHKVGEFVTEDPREANSEGGVFPAIFGTVLMVILMAIVVTPFGVIAAIYLHEYASQGPVTKMVRVAVNNLAGVPSIVFGVFGLGFFVYYVGGNIDSLFYPHADTPVFGTPGILWASLTLALLTLPVVIVSTEEGLSRISRAVREGSLALGATKAETLWRVILPMASPGIMTGLILAIARAAGEVAPLMLVGVVKLAPNLPMDGNAPYLHMDRKIMHLGFHIYDVGFQSPNSEAARPLVYATSLLLVLLIIVLNLAAVRIRNRLREKFRALQH